MSYVFDHQDAARYEKWLAMEKNRRVLELETRVMMEMLRPVPVRRLLDIGCGTGASLESFLNKGIELTGIDPSPAMLDYAGQRLGNPVDLYQGYAEDLPFADNSFHYAILFLTLEFCDDPGRALEEACRVAKDRVFVGILNRHSGYALRCRMARLFRNSVYSRARFLSISEVRRAFYTMLGQVPVHWRTVLQFPVAVSVVLNRLESLRLVQYSPFGGFAGIVADPVPRFQVSPLTLRCKVNQIAASNEQVAGWSRDYGNQKIQN